MINKSFFFLAGHHRSGTSLLHEIIREHPEISGFSNTSAPEDEGQHLQTIYKTAKEFGGPGKYIFDPDSHMTEKHSLATNRSSKEIILQWERHYDTSCEHYIEKSPPNLIRTRFLQELFPNSKFITILRHPIAVSYATQKWSKTSIKSLLEHTLLGYEIFMRDIVHLNNAYILRYEDFVANPQNEINKIYQFLNLDPIPIKHQVKTTVNEKYFSMWEAYNKNLFNKLLFKTTCRDLEKRANTFGYSIANMRSLTPSSLLGPHHKVIDSCDLSFEI